MKLVVVVQARTGSARLPNKVLLPLAGLPLILRQLERIRAAATPFELVVAIPDAPSEDELETVVRGAGYATFRGSPHDLLDRHVQAGRAFGADALAKIPSDCPLIDPQIIDQVLGVFLSEAARWDYVSNLHPATYPDGNDVEVMPFSVLEQAWAEGRRPHEREHTTPFIWDHPERFRLRNVTWNSGQDYSMTHRFTVDYPEDLAFVQQVFECLYEPSRVFSMDDILSLLEARPDIYALNAKHQGVNWYRHHLPELRTIGSHQTRGESTP